MSDPRRFLEQQSGLEQSLLRSARDDAPSPSARRRTLAALGLGTGVLSAGAAATAAAATTPSIKAATSFGLLKWVGVGIVSATLAFGVAEVAHSVAPSPTQLAPGALDERAHTALPEPRSPAHDRAPTLDEPIRAANAAALGSASAIEPLPSAARIEAPPRDTKLAEPAKASSASPIPDASRPHATTPSSAVSALADEIAALDAARAALAAGDASGALRALDARERAFPRGALGPEARVVRIEALLRRGDREAATRLGEAFLASSPRSPHASRIRTLLGIAPPPAAPSP